VSRFAFLHTLSSLLLLLPPAVFLHEPSDGVVEALGRTQASLALLSPRAFFDILKQQTENLGDFFGISLSIHYLCRRNHPIKTIMEVKTREQIVNWLKAAQQRQQDWQQDVKDRWAERQKQAVSLTNKPSD